MAHDGSNRHFDDLVTLSSSSNHIKKMWTYPGRRPATQAICAALPLLSKIALNGCSTGWMNLDVRIGDPRNRVPGLAGLFGKI